LDDRRAGAAGVLYAAQSQSLAQPHRRTDRNQLL
jgi:hypothetical protein